MKEESSRCGEGIPVWWGGKGAAQVGRTETDRQTDRENIQCSYDHLKYLGFIVLSQNYDFFRWNVNILDAIRNIQGGMTLDWKCKHFRCKRKLSEDSKSALYPSVVPIRLSCWIMCNASPLHFIVNTFTEILRYSINNSYVRLVKAMVFPVVMYGCESWTVKKAEHRRIDAFELWCWRRLLRVPWTARRSNQSILKEISPGISLEGMMLKLKLQYFGHLMQRVDSLEKTLMLGGIGGRRRRGRQRMRWLDGITDSRTWVWVNSGRWWWTGRPGVLQFMGSQRVEHDWATELNWTEGLGK